MTDERRRTSAREHLERWRRSLLDLTRRNRLIDLESRFGTRIRIAGPAPAELADALFASGRKLRFPHARSFSVDDVDLGEARDETVAIAPGDLAVDPAPADWKGLQDFQRKLERLRRGARTIFEEQGVHTLFVALGVLEWAGPGEPGGPARGEAALAERDGGCAVEAEEAKPCRSPLLLVPVALEREESSYVLRVPEETVEVNPALERILERDFRWQLPEFVEGEGDRAPRDAVAAFFERLGAGLRAGFRIAEEAWLSQFAFHKLPMYRDLEGEDVAERAAAHAVVSRLCGLDPPERAEPVDLAKVEEEHATPELFPVLDADSSQLEVLDLARRGKNLAVQGPPGTGKSQTIVNLIAQALREGKTVLFVSEKRAALEVVYRRLARLGLDRLCLDLHSHESRRKAVVEELARTLEALRAAKGSSDGGAFGRYRKLRAELGRYVEELHRPRDRAGRSAYRVHGRLARLRSAPQVPFRPEFAVLDADPEWEEAAEGLLGEIARSGVWGEEDRHPWRDARPRADCVAIPDLAREASRALAEACREVARAGREVGEFLGEEPAAPGDLPRLRALLELLGARPPGEMPERSWDLAAPEIAALASRARSAAARRREILRLEAFLEERGVPEDLDPAVAGEVFRSLPSAERGWLLARFFARRRIRNALRTALGRKISTRVAVAGALALAKLGRERASLADEEIGLARDLGSEGALSEDALEALARSLDWLSSLKTAAGGREPPRLRAVAGSPERERTAARSKEILAALDAAERRHRDAIADETLASLFPEGAEGRPGGPPEGPRGAFPASLPFGELAERADLWAREAGRLPEWVRYRRSLGEASARGLGPFLEECRKAGVSAEALLDAFRRAHSTQWLKEAYARAPALASFDRRSLEDRREKFRTLDRELQKEAAAEALRAAARRLPDPLPWNEENRLRREAAKKTRHLPLRKLFPQIPKVLLSLKPCLLMSPLSVAQYLPKDLFAFDLVVFDEASQLPPGDAIGALLRGRQAVIFGDEKQLPPTDFFQAQVEVEESRGDGEEEPAASEATAFESVLGLASASFPGPMLRWHYRSRDERLIAFSNRRFYDGRLVTFPSPEAAGGGTGVSFVHVPEGSFARGGSRRNAEEARRVAELVLEQARREPDRTLGVIAMSIEQRDAIEEALRRARREVPELRLPERPGEPFFVKNLETVQGDERDAIILSVGYGPEVPGGVPSVQFGPLNREGGERRWNVAVTRARCRMVVVASFLPEGLAGRETRWEGPRVLREYLEYARLGGRDAEVSGTGAPESEFEEAVRDALVARGYEVDCQVGVSGYRIDLAVRDPETRRYAAGIECDGATYHGAATVRDRDRIREEVLRGLGWKILRVWSTDWIRDPERALEVLVEGIERARGEGAAPAPSPDPPQPAGESPGVAGAAPAGAGLARCEPPGLPPEEAPRLAFARYEKRAGVERRHWGELPKAPPGEVARAVREVVERESPVHREEAAERVLEAYGHGRRGKRLERALEEAFRIAAERGWIAARGEFLWSPKGEGRVQPRSPGDAARAPDRIAPEEWVAAVAEGLRQLGATARGDLARSVAAGLGFERLTEAVKAHVERAIDDALARGLAREVEGFLHPGAG